ncbi:unnamed protein product [Clavelina lepadiformis]|uniref:BTB domain-containing protein n=1 Tax=Clavelina lepadiformis TaxID=159417 RepID=A0ABP0GMI7_CLALP
MKNNTSFTHSYPAYEENFYNRLKKEKATDFWQYLNEDRKTSETLCNFTIVVPSEEFRVHKCVLVPHSQYFKTLLSSDLHDNCKNSTNIIGIPVDIMKIIVDGLYSDDDLLTCDNVGDVLAAADFLQIPLIKTECTDFIVANSNEDTLLADWILLNKYNAMSQSIARRVDFSINLCSSNKINELEFHDFESFLDLKADNNGMDLLKCITSWTEHRKNERKEYFPKLFDRIKLQQFKTKYLNEAERSNKLVKEDYPEILAKISEIKRSRFTEDCSSNHIAITLKRDEFGHQSEYTVFDATEKSLSQINSSDTDYHPVYYPGKENSVVIVQGDKLFAIGGTRPQISRSSTEFWCNCIQTASVTKWIRLRDLSVGRRKFGCTILEGCIYVAGGLEHNSRWLSSVEAYDIDDKMWVWTPSMLQKREGLTLVSFNGCLYAMGGTPNQSRVLRCVECYDGEIWRRIAPMKKTRTDFAAVVLNNHIYAIGGKTRGDSTTASVEKYDPSAKVWIYVASMHKPRSNHTACVSNGNIYVVNSKDHSDVEVYDSVKNCWMLLQLGK